MCLGQCGAFRPAIAGVDSIVVVVVVFLLHAEEDSRKNDSVVYYFLIVFNPQKFLIGGAEN